MGRQKQTRDPFRRFDSSPEVIRLVLMMYVRYPLSLRIVEDLLFKRGIDICHETVRLWWNRVGPMFAAEIRRKRVQQMRAYIHWRWHVDEVYITVTDERRYLWRAVDHEGEVLEGLCQPNMIRRLALRPLAGRDDPRRQPLPQFCQGFVRLTRPSRKSPLPGAVITQRQSQPPTYDGPRPGTGEGWADGSGGA